MCYCFKFGLFLCGFDSKRMYFDAQCHCLKDPNQMLIPCIQVLLLLSVFVEFIFDEKLFEPILYCKTNFSIDSAFFNHKDADNGI